MDDQVFFELEAHSDRAECHREGRRLNPPCQVTPFGGLHIIPLTIGVVEKRKAAPMSGPSRTMEPS
jgi:hypothetical protein